MIGDGFSGERLGRGGVGEWDRVAGLVSVGLQSGFDQRDWLGSSTDGKGVFGIFNPMGNGSKNIAARGFRGLELGIMGYGTKSTEWMDGLRSDLRSDTNWCRP